MKTTPLLKNTVFLAVLMLAQAFTAIFGTAAALDNKYNGLIQQGVNAAGIDVGGLSAAEAAEKLEFGLPLPAGSTFEIQDGGNSFSIQLSDIDAKYDYYSMAEEALRYGRNGEYVNRLTALLKLRGEPAGVPAKLVFSEEKLAAVIKALKTSWDSPPKNAGLILSNGKIEIVGEKAGCSLDFEETFKKVRLALSSGSFQVQAAGQLLVPDVKAADLSAIDTLLAEYVTIFNDSDRNRSHNIELASAAINGSLVKPGETFSLNRHLGPRIAEKGYLMAPIFIDSQLALDFGGGICQVATTLYNAALIANLDILERYSHPLPVSYVSPGRDATIAGDYLDLKFSNNTGAPVYISSNIESGALTISIFGAKFTGQREVRIITDKSVIEPEVVLQYDPSLPEGETRVIAQGKPGYTVEVYREVVVEGEIKTKALISSDYFEPSDRVLLAGQKPEGTKK